MILGCRACHLTASFGGEDSRPSGQVQAPAAVLGAPVQKGFSAMNFRILAASVWPRGRVFALVSATVLTGTLWPACAQAQAPAPGALKAKAAPRAAPKAPPAAPAPTAQQAAPPP